MNRDVRVVRLQCRGRDPLDVRSGRNLLDGQIEIGIDLDPEPLEYGRQNHFPKLSGDEIARVELIEGDVLDTSTSEADVVCAFNFSYFCFKTDEPLLIVRADQLYDWRVLRKIACAPFVPGIDAFALIDPASETLEWASGALCGPSCTLSAAPTPCPVP